MEPRDDDLFRAVTDGAHRFTDLAHQVRTPTELVRGSSWTAAELVAHVAAGGDAYAGYLEGELTPWADVSDLAGGSLAASNARRLSQETERDIGALSGRITSCSADMVAEARTRSLDEIVAWHGQPAPLRCHLASMVAEYLLHGLDLASSIGVPWPISKHEAAVVIENISPLLPVLVNPDTTRKVEATIRVRIRGGRAIPLVFDHGTLTVERTPDKFDATVSADPRSFLLVAYGRHSQWREIARGGLIAWGRRPWHALKLTSYLVTP